MIRRLAWRQLTHERLRFAAAVAGITFAVVLQLQQFGFRDALYSAATFVHNRLNADLVITSAQYEFIVESRAFPRRRLYEAQRSADVESVAALLVALAPFKDPITRKDHVALLLGISPDEQVFVPGSLPGDLDQLRIPETMLFDARSRRQFRPLVQRIRQGAVATEMAGRRLAMTGLFELGASFTGNVHLMTSDTTLRRVLDRSEGVIEIGLVRLKPGSDVARARAELAAAMPPDVRVMTRREFADLDITYWDRNSPIGFIFSLGVLVGLMVGSVIVYQILYTDVTNHLPEYATLKAMGYRDRALAAVVLQEALILSVLGFPIGVAISQVLYAIGRDATGLPIHMTATRAALVFGLTLAMCAASGLIAMRKLRAADPADAF